MSATRADHESHAALPDASGVVVRARPSAAVALIVDPDPTAAEWSAAMVERAGFQALRVSTGAAALDQIRTRRIAIACVDAGVDDVPPAALVTRLATIERVPVIATSAAPTVPVAVALIRAGAADLVQKGADEPFANAVRTVVARPADPSAENHLQRAAFLSRYTDLFRGSARMRAVEQMVTRVAALRAPVLILGENGVGKEQVALAIHYLSDRNGAPFVRISCTAVPPDLLEAEVFGHPGLEPGKLAAAVGGTVFLDEIAEAPSGVQSRLARVMHDGNMDVRFVASISADVYALLAAGRLRSDLYEALAVAAITVPPLRERREEIEVLARRFLETFSIEFQRSNPVMTDVMAEALRTYDWPGNVRELENLMKRWVVLGADTDVIVELQMRTAATRRAATLHAGAPGLREIGRRAAREAERLALQEALARSRGNRSAAARALKISYKTLLQKLVAVGLTPPKPIGVRRAPGPPK